MILCGKACVSKNFRHVNRKVKRKHDIRIHSCTVHSRTKLAFPRNQEMFRKITFWIESVFATVPRLLVFPHLLCTHFVGVVPFFVEWLHTDSPIEYLSTTLFLFSCLYWHDGIEERFGLVRDRQDIRANNSRDSHRQYLKACGSHLLSIEIYFCAWKHVFAT